MDKQQVTKLAQQARFTAEYIKHVHGDPRYLDAISKFFVETESGPQPLMRDIETMIVRSELTGNVSTAQKVFSYCADQYAQNYNLINAWKRGK